MGQKLRANRSSQSPPAPRRNRRASKRPARPKRRRFWACLPLLVVVLCLVVTGLGVVAAPGFVAGGLDGRANLLLMGIDRRAGTNWGYRTDTIMVISLEPSDGAASILSIPRDLQMPIPGRGEDRINTANVWGHSPEDPDAGPALLQSTIEGSFGIPINGYFMVDFLAFEQIIDSLGGIEVDVPRALHDTRYPDPRPGDPHAAKTVHVEPGLQHMDGRQALEYARSRMSTTDFDRAKRQQQVLLAVREKAQNPSAVLRWPFLAATMLDSVKTDMSPLRLLAVASSAWRIDASRLRQAVLEPPLVMAHRRADGASVQLPQWGQIDPVLDELFGRH